MEPLSPGADLGPDLSSLCRSEEESERKTMNKPGSKTKTKSRLASNPSCESLKSNEPKEAIIDSKRRKLDKSGSQTRPGPSCESLKSDRSKALSIDFKRDSNPHPALSCGSSLSDSSKDWDVEFKNSPPENMGAESSPDQLGIDPLLPVFTRLQEKVLGFAKDQLQSFHRALNSDYPECSERVAEEQRIREALLTIALHFLERMGEGRVAERLFSQSAAGVCRDQLQQRLQHKLSLVPEGVAKAGSLAPLKQLYTELYITEGGAAGVNQEHEVRLIESRSRRAAAPERPITCEDMFKGPALKGRPVRAEQSQRREPIRLVLTKGVAGVGKTVLTQKVSLDWAEGRALQDVQLLLLFTFRELNVLRDTAFSIRGLTQHFYSEAKRLRSLEQLQVLFILDGLDECRLPLDFAGTRVLTDDTESVSLDVLLVNLIRGNLLPSARLWITTRPAAANLIPAECVSMVTEVRGFTDPQKDEYFMKRFRDQQRAADMISHIKSSRSLYIMCHLPVFCWMMSTVLDHVMETGLKEQLPQTLTQMYIHFLVVQAKVKSLKYDGCSESEPHWSPDTREMVQSLGKLAFEQLQRGNLIFYDSDLEECGLDAAGASLYSGVFTQVFREEPGLYQTKVYCFIHLSVQEFLAALHVHLTFYSSGVNLLSPQQTTERPTSDTESSTSVFYSSAVKKAVESPNGHLDLFLRFLLGLSLPTNHSLLLGLQQKTGRISDTNEDTIECITDKLNDYSIPSESRMNLLHCLHELNDHSLLQQVQRYMREGHFSDKHMSVREWTAVSLLLLSSDSELQDFDIREYSYSENAFEGLLPVMKASRKVTLSSCDLEYSDLTSVVSSSALKHLDLSHCDLWDSKMEQLCSGLKSATCRLEVLSLSFCDLSHLCCESLASVLGSSALKHLDLSNNDLTDSGVEQLCSGLKSATCRLEVLRLSGCVVSERGGAALASALSSAHSHLTELDLSYNHPGASAEVLTAVRDHPHYPLHTLRLDPAGERWMVTGPRKYFCDVSLDPNTANNTLQLSEDRRTVTRVEALQLYPSHQDRFSSCPQLLSSTALTGRSYFEVECSGDAAIALSHRGIGRRGDLDQCRFGDNDQSWSLRMEGGWSSFYHCKRKTQVYNGCLTRRIGVFLDSEAGVLSLSHIITDESRYRLHSVSVPVSEPLFVGFSLERPGSSVSLMDYDDDCILISMI